MIGIERLRELSRAIRENVGNLELYEGSGPSWRMVAEVADQIERERAETAENQTAALRGLLASIEDMRPRLMPDGGWPRYADGSPVLVGSEIADPLGDAHAVTSVEFTEDEVALHWNPDEPEECLWLRPGERVKRPAPKVLDADGVEIRAGDTVWHVETGEQCKVVEADSRSVSVDFRVGGDCTKHTGSILPVNLTHRAPALAADGKPLREGETVWNKEDGTQLRVTGFGDEEDGETIVKVERMSGKINWSECRSLSLTHERPDSWERLEEDARKPRYGYWGCESSRCRECPAVVDGKNPQEQYGVDDCQDAMQCDLVRRARALAERGAR